MRFLGVGETCDLGALYVALQAEGHEVRVAVSEPEAQGTLAGLVPRSDDWRLDLDWVREAGREGVILFESVSEGFGALQDALRRDGFNVIGGSTYGDQLENDRAFAQSVLAELGFPAGHVWAFERVADALALIAERPARYVLKYSGADHASGDTYVGRLSDGRDVGAVLRTRDGGSAQPRTFILMDFIEGIETGVGAYFDGENFITPACMDWEHKRFFAGDLGEMTGEMGTVVTFERTHNFFRRTLGQMEERLRANGYVGYINLNTIVNEQGIWPLEFTCRFGYPGYAILAPLQATAWGELFRMMVTRSAVPFQTRPGFCTGIVLTTPPFPYTRKEVAEPVGLPILFEDSADLRHYHIGEAGLDHAGQMVTSGLYGWTLVVTGTGASIAAATRDAYDHVAQVFVPNARYRLDIGARLISGDYDRLERLGLLDPSTNAPDTDAQPPAIETAGTMP
jgi:phosphoribosylamine--glycine ligase